MRPLAPTRGAGGASWVGIDGVVRHAGERAIGSAPAPDDEPHPQREEQESEYDRNHDRSDVGA